MTREEAITWLIQPTVTSTKVSASKAKEQEAYDMAIEALQVEPTKAVCDDCIWHVCNYNKVDWDTPSAEVVHKPDYSYEADMVRRMKEALSAEAVQGEWVECESNHIEKIYVCSNCQNYEAWGEAEKTPYCPNCGAKMRGENHD